MSIIGIGASGQAAVHASAIELFAYTGAPVTWTVPAGVTSVEVELWGGGGGGSAILANPGNGGGGGAYVRAVEAVTPGEVITYAVGAGGGGGAGGGNNNGGPGTQTYWRAAGNLFANGGAAGTVGAAGAGGTGGGTLTPNEPINGSRGSGLVDASGGDSPKGGPGGRDPGQGGTLPGGGGSGGTDPAGAGAGGQHGRIIIRY